MANEDYKSLIAEENYKTFMKARDKGEFNSILEYLNNAAAMSVSNLSEGNSYFYHKGIDIIAIRSSMELKAKGGNVEKILNEFKENRIKEKLDRPKKKSKSK